MLSARQLCHTALRISPPPFSFLSAIAACPCPPIPSTSRNAHSGSYREHGQNAEEWHSRSPFPSSRSRSKPGHGPLKGKQRGRPGASRSRGSAGVPDETKKAPSREQLRLVLLRRITQWADADSTWQTLRSLGFEDRYMADNLLNGFARAALASLDPDHFGGDGALDAVEDSAGGIQWDIAGLTLALQHEYNWIRAIERSYLRNFLEWTVGSYEADPAGSLLPDAPQSLLARLQEVLAATDLRQIATQQTSAREMRRHFHLHIGPTNSGKTYNALKALAQAGTGAYAGPLRLLAHEVWERMNRGTVGGLEEGQGRACNLITGEERRIVSLEAGLTSCTVEMLSMSQEMDVVVIDEIQMIGDPSRGGAWTNAILGLMAKEIHLCGEETVVPVIQELVKAMGDDLTIHRYERLTPLQVAENALDGDLSQVESGDCIVSFSRSGIFALKKEIEQKRGKRCAVVYGALPPETRSEQARLFNEDGNGVDIMVASDAVGMGLNLKIKRIVFESLRKFNGKEEVFMSFSQIKQIAGRAGRFGLHEKPAGGVVTTLQPDDLPALRQVLQSPLTPVPRAVVESSSDRLSKLAVLLPTDTRYSVLLQLYSSLVKLPAYCTVQENTSGILVSELFKAYGKRLALKEMVVFSFAPVNLRDDKAVAAFQKYLGAYIHDGEVLVEEALLETRLVANLEKVELARTAMYDPLEDGLAKHHLAPISGAIVAAIPGLESLHKALVLYLWLSFRLDLAFPDREKATLLKTRTEEALEYCLERLPGLKRTRKALQQRLTKEDRLAMDQLKEQAIERGKEGKNIKYMSRDEVKALRTQSQFGTLDFLPEGTESVQSARS